MPTTHTTPIDLRSYHGREFEGVLNDHDSNDVICKGKICIDKLGDVYLCQNKVKGIRTEDTLGFDYSWIAQESNESLWSTPSVKSITILDPLPSIDPQWDWKDGEEVACGSHLQKIFILINGSVIHIVNDKGGVVNSGTPEGVDSLGYRKLPTRKLTEITEEMFDKTNLIGRKVVCEGSEKRIYGMIDGNGGRKLKITDTDIWVYLSQCKLIEE